MPTSSKLQQTPPPADATGVGRGDMTHATPRYIGASPGAGGNVPLLYTRLKWTLFIRVIAVTFLLGATAALQLRASQSLITAALVSLYGIVAATYFVTLLSVVLLTRLRRLTAFAYAQIVWEIALVTAVITVTGGNDSPFFFLYLLNIILGSILLYRMGAFIAASLSSLAGGAVVILQFLNKLPAPGNRVLAALDMGEAGYSIFLNVTAFFLVAFLSSYLAEQLRRTGRALAEHQRNIKDLATLNDNILQSMENGLATTDRNGAVLTVNRALEAVIGVPWRDESQYYIWELLPQLRDSLPPELPPHYQPPPTTPRNDGTVCEEIEMPHPDKGPLQLEVTRSPLRNMDDDAIGFIYMIRDMTALRKMEEQLKIADRLAAAGELAAGIAHEIRNPLASISGSVQLLQDTASPETQANLMSIVQRETDRLNTLITDFLSYARPAPGLVKDVDLSVLIGEVVELFSQHAAPDTRPDVRCEVETGLVAALDPKVIRQVLWNLLLNAAEAMPDGGGITIRAHTNRTEVGDAGESIFLSVGDTGCGMTAEQKERIFDPFYTTKDRGTGLGLAVVYRIVDAMGGDITVDSAPGEGATFTVHVPRRLAGVDAAAAAPAAPTGTGG